MMQLVFGISKDNQVYFCFLNVELAVQSTLSSFCQEIEVKERVPYPFDCTKYIRCQNGTGTLFDCPVYQYFSPIVSDCTSEGTSNCRGKHSNILLPMSFSPISPGGFPQEDFPQ